MALDFVATNKGSALRQKTPANISEDLRLLRAGILTPRSFAQGYKRGGNAVEMVARHGQNHPDPAMRGKIKAIRRSHNGRTNLGGQWMQRLLSGDVSTSLGAAGTTTAVATNSFTDSGASFPVSAVTNAPTGGHNAGQTGVSTGGYAGHIAVLNGNRYGVILGNAATQCFVDQWYTIGSATGAVGSNPGATVSYVILPGSAPGLWLGLSTTALTTSNMFTDDTSLSGEITTNGSGLLRAFAPITPITPPSTAQAMASGQVSCSYTVSKLFTAAGAGTYNVQGAGLYVGGYRSTAIASPTGASDSGAWLLFENAVDSANLIGPNGDTITVQWTFTLS